MIGFCLWLIGPFYDWSARSVCILCATPFAVAVLCLFFAKLALSLQPWRSRNLGHFTSEPWDGSTAPAPPICLGAYGCERIRRTGFSKILKIWFLTYFWGPGWFPLDSPWNFVTFSQIFVNFRWKNRFFAISGRELLCGSSSRFQGNGNYYVVVLPVVVTNLIPKAVFLLKWFFYSVLDRMGPLAPPPLGFPPLVAPPAGGWRRGIQGRGQGILGLPSKWAGMAGRSSRAN